MAPLWWIWLSTAARLVVCGDPYFGYRRGDVRGALFVANCITAACRRIREAR